MIHPLIPALAAALLLVSAGAPQEPDTPQRPNPNSPDPMARFEFLIGGEWHSAQDQWNVFEWGLGHKSLLGRTYVNGIAGPALVSEARWFWHPGKGAIVGIGVLQSMPFELIEMNGEWVNGQLQGQMTATRANGSTMEYSEVWKFVDKNHYEWTMNPGQKSEMTLAYERRNAEGK